MRWSEKSPVSGKNKCALPIDVPNGQFPNLLELTWDNGSSFLQGWYDLK